MPLVAPIPPATLSIITSACTETRPFQVPVLDWASMAWGPNTASGGMVAGDSINPSALIRKIASETAEERAVVSLIAPAANSSYTLQFFGPTLQCNDANSSQQASFDSYMAAYANQTGTLDYSQFESYPSPNPSTTIISALVFSAFSSAFPNLDQPFDGINPIPNFALQIPQIWVQTANRSIVCVMVNASFDVGFEFSSGVQNVYQRRIEAINEISSLSTCDGVACMEESSYFGNFLTWCDLLDGNVTMALYDGTWTISEATSNVLLTGLAMCEEIAHNCWNSIFPPNSTFYTPNITDNNFPGEPWECRNRTIDRGIEDLINNITISMLGSPNLT